MIARFILFLIGVLIGTACVRTPNLPTRSQVQTHNAFVLADQTVAFVDSDVDAYCAGVWIAADLIVTAAHCVREPMQYVTRGDVYPLGDVHPLASREARSSTLLRFDPMHDLALVKADKPPSHGTATLALQSPRQGQYAQTMGHPIGLWWSYSSGEVSAVRQRDILGHNQVWVQSSAPFNEGNSGGGLFDEDNRLIGIASAFTPAHDGLSYFVHMQYVRALLAAS